MADILFKVEMLKLERAMVTNLPIVFLLKARLLSKILRKTNSAVVAAEVGVEVEIELAVIETVQIDREILTLSEDNLPEPAVVLEIKCLLVV